eukprot:s8389_g1.t1
MVASTCLAEDLPLPRGAQAVALYEIGSDEKTYEVGSSGLYTAEPMSSEDMRDPSVWNHATNVLRDLTPGTNPDATEFWESAYMSTWIQSERNVTCEDLDGTRRVRINALAKENSVLMTTDREAEQPPQAESAEAN